MQRLPAAGASGVVGNNSEVFGDIDWEMQPRFVHNESGRFESRFSTVRIEQDNKAMMFKGMEGSVLGVWVAHGEGRAHFPNENVKADALKNGLAPLRYADDNGAIAASYPFNPNGSPEGIAGLCSSDGRHLAIMPHPERVFRKWQWPYAQKIGLQMGSGSSRHHRGSACSKMHARFAENKFHVEKIK